MTTHGQRYTTEYKTWSSMKARCNNPRNISYRLYGARGISVCAAWESFEAFIRDMGPKPSPDHSIDRIDNDLGYSPENCRWASLETQSRNRRTNRHVTFMGRTMTVSEASELSGLPHGTLISRVDRGDDGEALFRPPVQGKSPRSRRPSRPYMTSKAHAQKVLSNLPLGIFRVSTIAPPAGMTRKAMLNSLSHLAKKGVIVNLAYGEYERVAPARQEHALESSS